jgi:hypothetical protein
MPPFNLRRRRFLLALPIAAIGHEAVAAPAHIQAEDSSMDDHVYVPDDPDLTGSMAVGNGLRSLAHSSGDQGRNNIAIGINAGELITTGKYNILIGANTGRNMTSESVGTTYPGTTTHGNTGNTFVGQNAAVAANGALDNTGIGVNVMLNLTTGMDNFGAGINALQNIEGGSENVATGHGTLQYLVGGGTFATGTGHRNAAHGDMAGRFLNSGANKTGGNASVYVGAQTSSAGNDVFNENVFGYDAAGRGSNTISYGSTAVTAHFFAGGAVYMEGAPVTDKAPNAYIDPDTGKVMRSTQQTDANSLIVKASVILPNGASAAIPTGSGHLIIMESSVTGEIMDIVFGANTFSAIRQSGSIYVRSDSPGAGQVGFSYDPASASYRIFNNHGGTRKFDYTLIKVRGSN